MEHSPKQAQLTEVSFTACMLVLTASLAVWGGEGKRGVWIKVPLSQSELIPSAAKVGGTATFHVQVADLVSNKLTAYGMSYSPHFDEVYF